MLIAFVVLYLLVTIAIGLWAAQRVHNSRDYVVAGRSLPLYMNTATVFATWFGAESVLSVSVEFSKSGLGGIIADPFGSSMCLVIVAIFCARVLPNGPADHRRLLPQALRQDHGARHQRGDRHLLPRLDRGPAHRARAR